MTQLLDCPGEIVRDIFTRIKRADLKNVRLTCKTCGDIGAEILLPTVHVVFTKQSIERLRDISLHHIFSLHLNEIIYEADRLDHFGTQKEWEDHVVDPHYLENLNPDTLEELQSMARDESMTVFHRYSAKKLNRGWKRYKALHEEQLKAERPTEKKRREPILVCAALSASEASVFRYLTCHIKDICQRKMDVRDLGRAVMRMPRLERITVNIDQALTPNFVSPYFAHSFKTMLVPVGGENALKDGEPPGFRHFLPLLLPFASPEKYDIKSLRRERIQLAKSLTEEFQVSTLNRLCMGGLSWLCLRQLEPAMSALPMALAQLKTLVLVFNTGEVGPGQLGAELDDCAKYLGESDALHKFISACPSLTRLDLSFGSISPEAQAASLEHIVGRTTWNSLHQITFRSFKTPTEPLLSFLTRHQDSLRDVVLENVCIGRVPEKWSNLLSGVRALNIPWKHFRITENMLQDGLDEASFYVDSSEPEDGPHVAQMIEDYVKGKTDFDPLKAATVDETTGETIWHDEQGKVIGETGWDDEWEDVSSDDGAEDAEV